MGNTKSSALSKELLEELKSNTKYSESELCTWYQSFLKECPSGKISKQQFEGIYASFFPNADPTEYARHVFRSFDTNADGTLDFKEYIVALHLTSGGKTLQKLEWAFALYDVDGNGTISKNEILEIVRVLISSSFLMMVQKIVYICFIQPEVFCRLNIWQKFSLSLQQLITFEFHLDSFQEHLTWISIKNKTAYCSIIWVR